MFTESQKWQILRNLPSHQILLLFDRLQATTQALFALFRQTISMMLDLGEDLGDYDADEDGGAQPVLWPPSDFPVLAL